MSEVDFRIDGVTDADIELRLPERRQHWTPRSIAVVAVAVPLVLRAMQAGSGGALADGAGAVHVGIVNGTEVRANRVLVLLDRSGSMTGTDPQVQLQLNRLAAAGIAIGARVEVDGFALSFSSGYSVLTPLDAALRDQPSVDAVYVISDFSQNDDLENEPAAIATIRRTLERRRIRLYWATVRDEPPPAYRALARVTGGGIIP